MKITIAYTNEHARRINYFLRRRYNSRAGLEKLVRLAIAREVGAEAEKELKELEAGKEGTK